MNALPIVLICLAIVFHQYVILLAAALPVSLISTIKEKFRGELPRGNRFVSWADALLLHWISQVPSHCFRMFYYKYIFKARIGKNVVIYKGREIRHPQKLVIGDGTIIGDDAILDARAGLYIGKNVNLSSRVSIWTLQHDYRDPEFKCNPEHFGPVRIGDRAWLGPNTIILPAVSIGEGAVVGAGAVVTKDVKPFSLVGGVPAHEIGERPKDIHYRFDGSHRLFI